MPKTTKGGKAKKSSKDKSKKSSKDKSKKSPVKSEKPQLSNAIQRRILAHSLPPDASPRPSATPGCPGFLLAEPLINTIKSKCEEMAQVQKERKRKLELLQRSLDSGLISSVIDTDKFESLLSSLTDVGKLLIADLRTSDRSSEAATLAQTIKSKLESIIS